MKHTLHFKTLPLTTNHMYIQGRGYRFVNPKVRDRKLEIAKEAMAQFSGEPVDDVIQVKIALRWPTRANHDVDNIKMLLDALTGILWVDDGLIVDLRITKEYNKENPGVTVEVTSPAQP